MQRFLQGLFGTGEDTGALIREFTRRASKFYDDPESHWEPIEVQNKTFYVLKDDPARLETLHRLTYLDRECTKVYNRLVADPKNTSTRWKELTLLQECLAPGDGICHIVQKPFGGYDVRAYAHDNWIFIELPTFASIESDTNEERKRKSLLHIILHEVAHVAGYWEHNEKHEKCIAWLEKYT
jgi:hypothetical protein